ncbi:MAG: hypothetical protein JWO45_426 [Spartobacteria bacterium]|nr:hypothetical protein [Spartobacteria bacterium]
MPRAATEFQAVAPGIALWQIFDPRVKADLYSTAVETPAGICLIDPIPLADSALKQLLRAHPPCAIVVTNQNHWRASPPLADQLSVPIIALAPDPPMNTVPVSRAFAGMKIGDALEVIPIEGAVDGEIALYTATNNGTLIFGDALINLEPYGFDFLPRKYCINQKEIRRSLEKILDRKVERILFAHGTPICSGASKQLRDLLTRHRK